MSHQTRKPPYKFCFFETFFNELMGIIDIAIKDEINEDIPKMANMIKNDILRYAKYYEDDYVSFNLFPSDVAQLINILVVLYPKLEISHNYFEDIKNKDRK